MLKQVKIGYLKYQVVEVESVNKFEPRKGEIDLYQRQIRIDKDMTDQDKRETLLHEIIHGLDEFIGIDLEESQVRKLGAGLATVFEDNPELLSTSLSSFFLFYIKELMACEIRSSARCCWMEHVSQYDIRKES